MVTNLAAQFHIYTTILEGGIIVVGEKNAKVTDAIELCSHACAQEKSRQINVFASIMLSFLFFIVGTALLLCGAVLTFLWVRDGGMCKETCAC